MSWNSWYDVNEPGDIVLCVDKDENVRAWRCEEDGTLNPVALDEVLTLQVAKRIHERKTRKHSDRLAELIEDDL